VFKTQHPTVNPSNLSRSPRVRAVQKRVRMPVATIRLPAPGMRTARTRKNFCCRAHPLDHTLSIYQLAAEPATRTARPAAPPAAEGPKVSSPTGDSKQVGGWRAAFVFSGAAGPIGRAAVPQTVMSATRHPMRSVCGERSRPFFGWEEQSRFACGSSDESGV
jgi:hypothetical protein